MVLIGGIRSGNHVEGLVVLHHRTARAAAQEIERRVVGDTEQPAFRVVDDTDIRHRGKGLNQRVLDNVLAIDGGAGHARAVSMELWSKLTRQLFELIAHRISHCRSCLSSGWRPYESYRRSSNWSVFMDRDLLRLRGLRETADPFRDICVPGRRLNPRLRSG